MAENQATTTNKTIAEADVLVWLTNNTDTASKVCEIYSDIYKVIHIGIDRGKPVTHDEAEKVFGRAAAFRMGVLSQEAVVKLLGTGIGAVIGSLGKSEDLANASKFFGEIAQGKIKSEVSVLRGGVKQNISGDAGFFKYLSNTTAKYERLDLSKLGPKDDAAVLKEWQEFVKKKFANQINKAMRDIEKIYTGLFASGYGVIEPEGLLAVNEAGNGAFLKLEKGTVIDGEGNVVERSVAVAETDTVMSELYRLLAEILDLRVSTKRNLERKDILKSSDNYFPYRLLEYTFGRTHADEEWELNQGVYRRHSNSKVWKGKNGVQGYYETAIEEPLKKEILQILATYLKAQYSEMSLCERDITGAAGSVETILQKIERSYTPCILVYENSTGRLKIRVSDIEALLSNQPRIGDAEIARIKDFAIKNLEHTYEKGVEPFVYTSLDREYNSIVEFEVIRNSKLVGAVPLFAYTALDKLKEMGETVSWNNIILGRAEDESIYTGNNGTSGINFNAPGEVVYHLSAGSRSGKGVMTLNILASAFAGRVPVFYLDSKPDMAALLRRLAPAHKTFAISGGSWSSMADDERTFDPSNPNAMMYQLSDVPGVTTPVRNEVNGSFRDTWKNRIPSAVRSLSTYEGWSSLQYFKALDFCIFMIDKIGSAGFDCSCDNILVIADELWRELESLNTFLNAMKEQYTAYNKKVNARGKDKPEPTEKEKYGAMIVKWQDDATRSWELAKTATLNSKTSCLLTIYQERTKETKQSKFHDLDEQFQTSYLTQGNYNTFHAIKVMGTRGIIGRADTYPKDISEHSKVKKYLNDANRYFAFVKDIMNPDMDSAEFFKPFLILNDAAEVDRNDDKKSYVGQLKGQMKKNGLDPEQVLEQHRVGQTMDGELRPEIGFEGYIRAMGGVDLGQALVASYNLANEFLTKMGYFEAAPGSVDIFDYLFDFRPEFMPTWTDMNESLATRRWHSGNILDAQGGADEEDEIDGMPDELLSGAFGDSGDGAGSGVGSSRGFSDGGMLHGSMADDSAMGQGQGPGQGPVVNIQSTPAATSGIFSHLQGDVVDNDDGLINPNEIKDWQNTAFDDGDDLEEPDEPEDGYTFEEPDNFYAPDGGEDGYVGDGGGYTGDGSGYTGNEDGYVGGENGYAGDGSGYAGGYGEPIGDGAAGVAEPDLVPTDGGAGAVIDEGRRTPGVQEGAPATPENRYTPENGYFTAEQFSNILGINPDEFKAFVSYVNSRATGINPSNPKVYQVDGSEQNRPMKFTQETSVDCSGAVLTDKEERRIFGLGGRVSVKKYRERQWGKILDIINSPALGGFRRGDVALVWLYEGVMYVNKKAILLNGIVGETGLPLEDLVSYTELFKAFPGIVELKIDLEFLRRAVLELGEEADVALFGLGKSLMNLNIITGYTKEGKRIMKHIEREQVLKNGSQLKVMPEINKMKNKEEMDAMFLTQQQKMEKEAAVAQTGKPSGRKEKKEKPGKVRNKDGSYNYKETRSFRAQSKCFDAAKTNFVKAGNAFTDTKRIRPGAMIGYTIWSAATGLAGLLAFGVTSINRIRKRA